jgi:hypothetical protein
VTDCESRLIAAASNTPLMLLAKHQEGIAENVQQRVVVAV